MSKPLSRGVHHLALNTDDMKMTLDFYLRVLGMPLVHALKVPPGLGTGPGNRGNPPFENIRHYFLDAGGDSLLAFFSGLLQFRDLQGGFTMRKTPFRNLADLGEVSIGVKQIQ